MLDKIAMILRSESRLETSDLYMVGVSGGPDSLCLLHVLHRLGYPVIAVHVNHHLRPEADQEARMVEAFVNSLGIELTCCNVDAAGYASEHGLSIEEAAREVRYACLFAQAAKSGAKAVLVAHNADDQVETLLLHLLRGSGLSGLRGMEYRTLPNPWSLNIPIVRPLLSTWREEILAYLVEQHISYASDQSNYDLTYLRNRVRHELLPYLEKYNPRIRENFLRMSRINQDDYGLLQEIVNQAWKANLVKQGPGYVAFRLAGFHTLPVSTQRYLVRRAIAHHLPSLRDIDFESIERGIHFLNNPAANGQADLIAGLRLLKEGDIFWLATWQADLPGSEFPSLTAGTSLTLADSSLLDLNDGWRLLAVEEADLENAIRSSSANKDPFQAWLDLDELALPLVVRGRRTGERFQPLGMGGHSMKVSDLMVNVKMPPRIRSTWPLVCSNDAIVWIPGCRPGHLGRVQPATRRVMHLSLSRDPA